MQIKVKKKKFLEEKQMKGKKEKGMSNKYI